MLRAWGMPHLYLLCQNWLKTNDMGNVLLKDHTDVQGSTPNVGARWVIRGTAPSAVGGQMFLKCARTTGKKLLCMGEGHK